MQIRISEGALFDCLEDLNDSGRQRRSSQKRMGVKLNKAGEADEMPSVISPIAIFGAI